MGVGLLHISLNSLGVGQVAQVDNKVLDICHRGIAVGQQGADIFKQPFCLPSDIAPEKLYYNVGIDDKFGFDPENDWAELYEFFMNN